MRSLPVPPVTVSIPLTTILLGPSANLSESLPPPRLRVSPVATFCRVTISLTTVPLMNSTFLIIQHKGRRTIEVHRIDATTQIEQPRIRQRSTGDRLVAVGSETPLAGREPQSDCKVHRHGLRIENV